MKALFDYQAFELQKVGGISRYFYELMRHFNIINQDYEIGFGKTANEYLPDPCVSLNKIPDLPFEKWFLMKYNIVASIQALQRKNFDVFHPTYYYPYFLEYIGDTPFVLTVYDMIHEMFAQLFHKEDFTSQWKKVLVERAHKVIAISQSTKNDLIRILGVPPEKIEVIYLANSLVPVKECPKGLEKLPEKYILYVGGRGSYKNFMGFIQAAALLLKQDPNLYVICIGGREFLSYETELFKQLGIERQVVQCGIPDHYLSYFYQKAQCFVLPSFYEGFGIPVLEAFACSCPAIISRNSSLPEVGGDAALYVDLSSQQEMYNAINRVLNDPHLRASMVHKGHQQLAKFSWKKCAEETIQVYQKCAAKK